MTFQQFDILCKHIQYRDLILNGVCIGDRMAEDDAQVLLFQLPKGYVEVYFDHECSQLLHSRSFEDTDELEPYLSNVQIPE